MNLNLSHRVVVVTGAARGIGAQVARDLVWAGAHVAILDRDIFGAQRLAAELGSTAAAFEVDVTSFDSVEVEAAAAATTTGIARRSRRVYAPWWVGPMLDLRPLLFLADRILAVLPSVRRTIHANEAEGIH